jgi:hypothetical protein
MTNKLAPNRTTKGGNVGLQRQAPREDKDWLTVELAKVPNWGN